MLQRSLFGLFGATLKTTVYLLGLSKGNFGRLETKVAFSSDRKLLAIPWVWFKNEE